jgi:hypothetical protein
MVSVKDKEPSASKKRTIKFKNIDVRNTKFVDDTGDITEEVLKALPDGVDFVDFRITINLDEVE